MMSMLLADTVMRHHQVHPASGPPGIWKKNQKTKTENKKKKRGADIVTTEY